MSLEEQFTPILVVVLYLHLPELGFNGGSIAHVPGNSAILAADKRQVLSPIIARGIDVDFTDSVIRNDQIRTSPLTLVGASDPFVGNMGKINHVTAPVGGAATLRAVWGEPGVAVSSTTGASDDLLTTPYPGTIKADGTTAPSSQQLIIYASNAESETASATEIGLVADALFAANQTETHSSIRKMTPFTTLERCTP